MCGRNNDSRVGAGKSIWLFLSFTNQMKSVSHLVVLSTVCFLLAACAQAKAVATEIAGNLTQNADVSEAAATAAFSLTKETPPPQLPKEACLADGGRVEAFVLESEHVDGGFRLRVYTPPCYEQSSERYPVLFLIHGQSFTEDQWDRLGADEAADKLIASGELPPFIIVMPYDRSNYTQPSKNGFDEAFVDELLPWVRENYRTINSRASRAVGGLSWGASWAIHFGLTHPELFGAVGGHSPPVFSEEASKVRGWLDSIPENLMPRFWLDIGERDQRQILSSATWFEGLLTEREIEHEWHLWEGDHSEAYWSSHVDEYLRWYAENW